MEGGDLSQLPLEKSSLGQRMAAPQAAPRTSRRRCRGNDPSWRHIIDGHKARPHLLQQPLEAMM
jgi:hypothetical protein